MSTNSFLQAIDQAMAANEPYAVSLALVLEHFAADSGTIHTRAGEFLELAAASPGMPDVVLEKIRTIPIGKGMAGRAAERRAPVDTCNLQTDTTGDVRPGAKATGLEGSIVVPILDAHDAPVGSLGVANRSERTFTDAEVATLTAIGRALAATRG